MLPSFFFSFQVALVLLFKSNVTLTQIQRWKHVGNCSISARHNVSIRPEGSPKPKLRWPKCILSRNPKASGFGLPAILQASSIHDILKLFFLNFKSKQSTLCSKVPIQVGGFYYLRFSNFRGILGEAFKKKLIQE